MEKALNPYCILTLVSPDFNTEYDHLALALSEESRTAEDGGVYYPGTVSGIPGRSIYPGWAHEVRAYRHPADKTEGQPRHLKLVIQVLRTGDGMIPQTITAWIHRGRANALVPALKSTASPHPPALAAPEPSMIRTYLILLPRQASKPTEETLDTGEIDYLGRLKVKAAEMDRLPEDPRYLFLDPASGLILRFNPTLGEHYIWKSLVDVFFAPSLGRDVITPDVGIWLDCQPPSDAVALIDHTILREAAPFAANLEVEVRPFRERIARGQRCLFVQKTAGQFLTYCLGVAMTAPTIRVRDMIPGVAISANQQRPAFAGGD